MPSQVQILETPPKEPHPKRQVRKRGNINSWGTGSAVKNRWRQFGELWENIRKMCRATEVGNILETMGWKWDSWSTTSFLGRSRLILIRSSSWVDGISNPSNAMDHPRVQTRLDAIRLVPFHWWNPHLGSLPCKFTSMCGVHPPFADHFLGETYGLGKHRYFFHICASLPQGKSRPFHISKTQSSRRSTMCCLCPHRFAVPFKPRPGNGSTSNLDIDRSYLKSCRALKYWHALMLSIICLPFLCI